MIYMIPLTLFAIWIIVKLLARYEANSWMESYNNQKACRKHYQREGITIWFYDPDKAAEICFYHKNIYYSRIVSWYDARKWMHMTQGSGIRKLLLKKFR